MAVGNRGGRPPKPTALKLVQGTERADRRNANEPQPDRGAPPVPSWLPVKARPHWRKIAPLLDGMGVLTVADGTALALLCDVLAEYLDARAVTAALGATYTSESIARDEDGNTVVTRMVRARPEVAMYQDAWKRARAMLAEFGLTPSSRSRLHVGGAAEEADPLEALLKGAQ